MNVKKRVLQIAVFLVIMFLTFYALFSGRDLSEIGRALQRMSPWYLIPSVGLAVFFVCAEGFMIWYLLRSMKSQKEGRRASSLIRCIQYSFIGFFYSGITPSATGGQPVQLYYMNKDGNRGSDSTVVLMTYLLGLLLNVVLVVLILGVMLFPKVILHLALLFEGLFIRMRIWKPSDKREEKINAFIDSYRQAVTWLRGHRGSLVLVLLVTFLQRCSVFVLTYMVYLGFGLQGAGAMRVILLQAAVYIAVDMLPLPGAQGITELMYQAVFVHVFTGAYLIPSMMVSRGINFYFLLIVSLGVVLVNRFIFDRRSERCYDISCE